MIEIIGQPLGIPIWIGRQWAVTMRGLEMRDGTVTIDRRHVWQQCYGVKAMSEMDGIDIDDYREALKISRRVHREGAEQ